MNPCPSCFADLAARARMCPSGTCPAPPGTAEPVRPAAPSNGAAGARGPAVAPPPPSGVPACRHCGVATVDVCPNEGCRFVLPDGWRDAGATTVALAGARATGKSVYIGVLVKQMEHFGELNGVRVRPATDRSAEAFRNRYETPLFVQRGLLPPTGRLETESAHLEPLVFDIAPRRGPRHYLVLRDVAGDDLENARELKADTLRYFTRADAVVFLFDPLGIPSIREQLLGLIPAQQRVGGDPAPVLATVLELMRAAPHRQRLAVVMSKFDALHSMRFVEGGDLSRIMRNNGAAFSREPSWFGPYSTQDGEQLHEEVRSLLHVLRASGIVTDIERAAYEQGIVHRFFASSALGDSPDGSHLHDRGIAPFRCLDPVRWALAGAL